MSCLSDKTKEKLIKKDLFQLRVREASAFGAFNSFVVLPILLIIYAIYLNVSNIEISESEMVTTKECAPFNFTCDYGCEVAAWEENHGTVLEWELCIWNKGKGWTNRYARLSEVEYYTGAVMYVRELISGD